MNNNQQEPDKKLQNWEAEYEKRFGGFIGSAMWYYPVKEFVREYLAAQARVSYQEGVEVERKRCYDICQQQFVMRTMTFVGDTYTDDNYRGLSEKRVHLIDKGDLLTNDHFIELLQKDGELVINGRHRVYVPKHKQT